MNKSTIAFHIHFYFNQNNYAFILVHLVHNLHFFVIVFAKSLMVKLIALLGFKNVENECFGSDTFHHLEHHEKFSIMFLKYKRTVKKHISNLSETYYTKFRVLKLE